MGKIGKEEDILDNNDIMEILPTTKDLKSEYGSLDRDLITIGGRSRSWTYRSGGGNNPRIALGQRK